MSEPTSDELVAEIGTLLNQGKAEEAAVLAGPLKEQILEHLREGNTEEARKLMPPIMLLPPDPTFLTQYAALTAAQMPEEEPKKKPKKRWQFWK